MIYCRRSFCTNSTYASLGAHVHHAGAIDLVAAIDPIDLAARAPPVGPDVPADPVRADRMEVGDLVVHLGPRLGYHLTIHDAPEIGMIMKTKRGRAGTRMLGHHLMGRREHQQERHLRQSWQAVEWASWILPTPSRVQVSSCRRQYKRRHHLFQRRAAPRCSKH